MKKIICVLTIALLPCIVFAQKIRGFQKGAHLIAVSRNDSEMKITGVGLIDQTTQKISIRYDAASNFYEFIVSKKQFYEINERLKSNNVTVLVSDSTNKAVGISYD